MTINKNMGFFVSLVEWTFHPLEYCAPYIYVNFVSVLKFGTLEDLIICKKV